VITIRKLCAQDELAQYRLAGYDVVLNQPLAELAAFRLPGAPGAALLQPPTKESGWLQEAEGARLVYQGPGWLGSRWRGFHCTAGSHGYRLSVDEVGTFAIAPDGRAAYQLTGDPAVTPGALLETLLGPILILALALQGTWCLHAGAALYQGKALLFLGESGAGKSTLAASLVEDALWQRLSDDVLPVGLTDRGGVEARPRYPQLKLAPDEQPSLKAGERLPIAAVYVIEPRPSGEQPAIQTLNRQDAALSLVRHTVSALLFGPHLLQQHLDFGVEAAAQIPVRRLSIPRQMERLPEIRRLVEKDFEAEEKKSSTKIVQN